MSGLLRTVHRERHDQGPVRRRDLGDLLCHRPLEELEVLSQELNGYRDTSDHRAAVCQRLPELGLMKRREGDSFLHFDVDFVWDGIVDWHFGGGSGVWVGGKWV